MSSESNYTMAQKSSLHMLAVGVYSNLFPDSHSIVIRGMCCMRDHFSSVAAKTKRILVSHVNSFTDVTPLQILLSQVLLLGKQVNLVFATRLCLFNISNI